MRLTVNLEDDLYALAKAIARSEDCSLSAAVNRLLRRAVEPRHMPPLGAGTGVPAVPCRTRFTSEDVHRANELDE
jgi:hypothetical protein